MSYGLPGCIEQHSRSGKTHYLSHSFAQDRLVTMYRAFFACTLFLSKRTTVETGMRIAKQLFTVGTKNLVFFLFSDNRGGSLTLLFSFRVRCVIPSSLSSLHFGLTKIAKIMQNHRRILLKCIFLVGIFFSDGKS